MTMRSENSQSNHEMEKMKAPIFKNPFTFIATGFGIGALPFAPGTWGSLEGVLLYLLFSSLSLCWYLILTVAVILLGVVCCHFTVKAWNQEDPQQLVIDEIAGFLVTMIAVPARVQWIVLGFILFRFFDIWKPWPISWLEKKIPGGLGVMIDDIAAGMIAFAILQLVIYFTA